MKKNGKKIAIMLYTAILHPIITCLIWLSYFHKLFLLMDINTKKEPEHLIEKILMFIVDTEQGIWVLGLYILPVLMVISSIILYIWIRKKQYLDLIQAKILLLVADILFIAMMGVVAVKCNELEFERAFVMGFPALFTLGVSGLLFIALLEVVLIEYMDRKKVKT